MRSYQIVGIILAALLAMQLGCGEGSLLDSDDAEYEGQITDSEGNPLEGVEISLAAPGMSTQTDIQGRYSFHQPPVEEQDASLKRGGRVIARFVHPMALFRLPRKHGAIKGQVTDSGGTPIVDAHLVLVQAWRIQVAVTNVDGSFAFSNVATGSAHLSAYQRGYASAHQEVWVQERQTNEVTFHLDLLPPTSEVGGQILNRSGDPVDGALVVLDPERRIDDVVIGARRLHRFFTFSDSKGNYQLADVPVGVYNLNVIRPPYLPAEQEIVVSPGQPLTLDIQLLTPEESAAQKDYIRMEVTGGFAGIHREIMVQTSSQGILLTDQTDRFGPSVHKWVAPEDYRQLWDILVLNDVFELQTNTSMTKTVADAFSYRIDVKRADEQTLFDVYAPEFLADETGEKRYNNIVQAVLRLAEAEAPPQPDLLLLPDDEESQARAFAVWEVAQKQPSVQHVLQEQDYQILIHRHAFSVGIFDPATAEWVVIVSSLPPAEGAPVVTAIVRLDYQTLNFKQEYEMRGVAAPINVEQAAATMSEHPPYEWWEDWKANPDDLERLGDFWTLSLPAGDFGATMIVDANTGRLIYSATTVWDGVGKQLIP